MVMKLFWSMPKKVPSASALVPYESSLLRCVFWIGFIHPEMVYALLPDGKLLVPHTIQALLPLKLAPPAISPPAAPAPPLVSVFPFEVESATDNPTPLPKWYTAL